jgi:hypothetical protein
MSRPARVVVRSGDGAGSCGGESRKNTARATEGAEMVQSEGVGAARLSHPILQGKPNASHMCARIIYTHMIDKTRVIPLL